MQKGKLGVIWPRAYADLLVVDGDPLTDLRVMSDPHRPLKVIMKYCCSTRTSWVEVTRFACPNQPQYRISPLPSIPRRGFVCGKATCSADGGDAAGEAGAGTC